MTIEDGGRGTVDGTREVAVAEEDDGPLDMPILRIEVTVAAAIQMPDGAILGSNIVDATQAFGWRADNMPPGLSDEQVNTVLSRQLSPVIAVVQTALVFQGWVAMGEVEEPMTESATATGEVRRSDPVRIELRTPTGPAIHD